MTQNAYRQLCRISAACLLLYPQSYVLSTGLRDQADAYHAEGLDWQRQGRFDAAVAAWQKSLALDPTALPVYHDLGMVYEQQGQLPEAQRTYEQLLVVDPTNLLAHRRLANLHVKAGRPQQALAEWMTVAALAEQLGQIEEAIEASEEALALSPLDIQIQMNLARLYERALDTERAIIRWRSIAESAEQRQDREGAVRAYTEALRLVPAELAMLTRLAELYEQLERPQEAASVWLRVGFYGEQQGAWQEARDAYQKVYHVEPEQLDVIEALARLDERMGASSQASTWWIRLAKQASQAGEIARAIRAYQHAIRFQPGERAWLQSLAGLYEQQGQAEQAIAAWIHLGRLAEHAEDVEAAEAAYGRVLQLDPRHPLALEALGFLYERMDEPAQAVAVWRRLYQLGADSCDPQILHAERRLVELKALGSAQAVRRCLTEDALTTNDRTVEEFQAVTSDWQP